MTRAGADRALSYLFNRQQKSDGSFPQNSTVDGTRHWTNTQLDEVADPIILAWQLGHFDAATYSHVKKAADYIVANGPATPQERWENQGGWSPATIASEIAGLVCASDIARRTGDKSAARTDLSRLTSGSASPGLDRHQHGALLKLYLLPAPDQGRHPNGATSYNVGDSGPTFDQRAVVDPSFLELVRLGVKPATDPVIRNTIQVVDQQLGVTTPVACPVHLPRMVNPGGQTCRAPRDRGVPVQRD